jgi:SAM-dependent methyltransferase
MNRIVSSFLSNTQEMPESVLEVGTGIGRAAAFFGNRNILYVGIEPTESLRKAAKRRLVSFDRVKILDLDFSTLSLMGQNFDHSFAVHVIEHASSPSEARSWISAMKDRTKQNGYVSLACPNFLSYGKYFYDGDWTHSYPTTPNRLIAIGNDIGLKLINCQDSRATFTSPLIKGPLLVLDKVLSTRVLNMLGKKVFGVDYLGTGLKVAIFWKLTVITFQKID